MTPAQAKVYKAIRQLTNKTMITPSYAEIAARVGLRSLATVHKHVHALIQAGHLETPLGLRRRVVRACTLSSELATEVRQLKSELAEEQERRACLNRDLAYRIGDAVSATREEYQEKLVTLNAELRERDRRIELLTSELDRARHEIDRLASLLTRTE